MKQTVTTAVLLAAGQSSRFYPYNKEGHKSLMTLLGKPLILHTLDAVQKSGITDVIIVEGESKSVSKALENRIPESLRVSFVVQKEADGMGEALLLCREKIKSELFFLLSAYHFDFFEFVHDLTEVKDSVVLLTQKVDDLTQFGSIARQDGKIVVAEKPKEGKTGEKIVGIYLLNQKFLDVLETVKKDHYSFEAAIPVYAEKEKVEIIETKKQTVGLKFPWDSLVVKNYLLQNIKSNISKNAKVSKKAVITGAVQIEDGATIMDGAVVTGPCYVGKNVYVGTNAVVRAGVCIEEGAVVGAQMEIKNSILMIGVKTHSGFIGDSVVGNGTKIAAGFHTANVRLDRREISCTIKGEAINTHVKSLGVIIGSGSNIGINVGTMPGVIIGNNVVIGPSTTVMENVPENTTFYTTFNKIVQKNNG